MRIFKASIRTFLLALALMASSNLFSVGWTPTDGGLVVNLNQGDKFLISVMIDHDNDDKTPDREYFVGNYTRYTGDDYFTYSNTSQQLKLIQQGSGATEPSDMTVWTVGAPLSRVDVNNYAGDGKDKDYALGGIVYTIWNDGKTIKTKDGSAYQFYGDLTEDYNNRYACDVVFVVPTNHDGITSFDPNKTLRSEYGRTDQDATTGRINGKTGTGFLGMAYREVYMMEIPRFNNPVTYTNAALVTFNTTKANKSWSAGTITPGRAAYAYADTKHNPTTRTIFRLYILNDPIVSCPDSYFFATDEQDYKKYRKGPNDKGHKDWGWTDSTAMKKIYTWDHLTRMDRVDETTIHKTGYMNVPVSDSTYYYVGYQNDYKIGGEKMGTPGAHSQFTKIRELPLANLPGFKAPAGAYGRMVLDSTSAADNHAVAFEPKRYFFQTNSRMNVNMRQVDDSTWMVEDMWYIDPAYMTLQARIMLSTEPEFSAADPGAAIEGWSVYTNATDIPVVGGGTASGQYGWARIHTNRTAANGGMEFIKAEQTKYVRYDNNGHFGATIPDQHPEYGKTKVEVQASRLIDGYNFTGWSTEANGGGTTYHAGDSIDLSGGSVTLYAQATYTGSINVAISFMQDGKRYFLTHPGAVAPRYASIRHFDDWTNVWQGMADINNDDPNYISSYKIIGNPTCIECESDEYVLDPRNETMKGAVDSLVFYENFHPEEEEYIGLYYANPYTIVANNTWAGLFTSSAGWPTPANPCVTSTQLSSDSYLERNGEGNIQRYLRTVTPKNPESDTLPAHILYNWEKGMFDAVTGAGTDFTISGVGVVDNHYIILPDTSEAWRDTLTFGYHQGERITEQVRSALIGKQLLAQMKLGNDTIYFHPNKNKLINDPNELYLSSDFRITQLFKFIPDARVTSVAAEDRTTQETTSDYWLNNIISGQNSPIGVKYLGEYIDIVDTFRITLSHGSISKIKKYYGRWDQDAEGLTVSADGSSRYRDVIIRTKTYHYGDTIDKLVLVPEQESYSFNPLKGNNRQINFQLLKVRSRVLYDTHNDSIREDWVKTDTITTKLTLGPSACSFSSGGTTMFNVVNASTVSDHVTLSTAGNNQTGENLDTLIVSTTVDGVPVSVRVPLVQMALEGDELVWSVVHGNKRYFLVAGTGGIQFREFTEKNSVLYKQGTSTHLKKGSADAANSDNQYITPWAFGYSGSNVNQLWLQTKYGINKYFGKNGSDKPGIVDATALWTYAYASDVYINDNGNEEEQVRLKYGTNDWLAFDGEKLTWAVDSASATVFTWSYLKPERYLLNNGTYPSRDTATFGYDVASSVDIQTRYKAYKDSSMLLNQKIVYLCREDENDIADLVNSSGEWLTDTTITLIRDARPFDKADPGDPDPVSGLSRTTNASNLTSTVTSTASSPTDVKIGGKYVNIVDTLDFRISLRSGAPSYKFQGNWSKYSSIEDAHVKIPLVRETYHTASFDSVICTVDKNQTNIAFKPNITPGVNDTIKYLLSTIHRTGSQVLNIYNEVASVSSVTSTYVTRDKDASNVGMHLNNAALAEIRLVDEYGNTPTWCKIKAKGDSTVTVQCLSDGIRSPRYAYLYFAYIVTIDGKMRFVNYRLTVSQTSKYDYVDNQILIHSKGASGDGYKANGMQQVHENKRIMYYYPDEEIELPVRERAFYGWWRWYREGKDEYGNEVDDADIPDSLWVTMPRNIGGSKNNYSYPFRTIGNPDSVWVDPSDHSKGKHVVTMGRYTVFHYKSRDYNNKTDAPAKTPVVVPPINKDTLTYAVDISAYYDNLPMSVSQKNQVDTARLDTMRRIPEPTLSLREVFELHPWTEMAERLEGYKDTLARPTRNLKYMEDHTVMAPLGNRLLLRTEQRYNYDNLQAKGHSDSQLGYYMRDDKWSSFSSTPDAKGISERDTMVWLGGWDADCVWYTYDPTAEAGREYTECTYSITVENDFLNVPAKTSITPGKDADTVYYCLRARSKSSASRDADPTDGLYMFNICRYTVIYHRADKYGPKLETDGKALITNEEIEQHYEVLERLNFDYNLPGKDYTVYPHPLPWADASYGYTYPETPDLPHNRYHDESDFPNLGEYGLVNRIPYSSYWHKMEQHGGAENGYMIYCDGMSSAGQVAALSLSTHLCEGQRMYFSAYVGNPSNQKGKSCPNFTFSVQGSENGTVWEDITSYMTGDLEPSDKWYQIYFPIQTVNSEAKKFEHFRVRIYNMASSFDGNDFIIDDMCLFATKPALVAYQANTTCGEGGNDSINHVIFRIDYQGINNSSYNDHDVFYTIEKITPSKDTSFVAVEDEYLNEETKKGAASKPDTIYGTIPMPAADYEPTHIDSVYSSVEDLVDRFDDTHASVKQGYVYEEVDNVVRPVMYVVHIAKVTLEDTYIVRMSADFSELINSICALTDTVDISNRMMFEVDGVERAEREITNLCPNSSYDIGVRVKGSLFREGSAPTEINGTCFNDWLLYGDTAAASSRTRYKYTYSDIVKVVTDILRREDEANTNRFATNLSAVSSAVMTTMSAGVTLETSDNAYTVLSYLVNKGFLTLYQKKVTASLIAGDSVQYVALPITGTGYDDALKSEVQVCPNPMLIKLKPKAGAVHLVIGGLHRDSTQASAPVVVLANEETANDEIQIHIDSLIRTMTLAVLDSIYITSTNDPNFRKGVHSLMLIPDTLYDFSKGAEQAYYKSGSTLTLRPAASAYHMRPGYKYSFVITLQTRSGAKVDDDSCPIGSVPFVVSVVPDYIRWNPQTAESNQWNNPDNWLGVTSNNVPIHENAHFAPLPTSSVIIPTLSSGLPYPELPASISSADSIKEVGFTYNTCNAIRFMPGAAIGQQQRLDYNIAVVDMELPHNTWALRGAPINGMLSGDIYMSNADYSGATLPWEVSEFDASGRNEATGNASIWLSVYSRSTEHKDNGVNGEDEERTCTTAEWSKVTNGMTLSLPAAQGWAVYARTASTNNAIVRLPKNDDIYYYYSADGDKMHDIYVNNVRAARDAASGGAANTGKLSFHPDGASQNYTLAKDVPDTMYVFGNPTMGYIDIWGFIADNGLENVIGYLDKNGHYNHVSKATAEASSNTIDNPSRYLPPQHAMIIKVSEASPSKEEEVRLNANRIVTNVDSIVRPLPSPSSAPRRNANANASANAKLPQGIMTVTAINPVSSRCTSYLHLGQGYHNALREGEDAILTTINIDKFSLTNTPTTPFNIYAVEDGFGLSIDLRDSLVNVPLSFFMSDLPYDPTTQLWFTGVNNISGSLVLYDALTDTEREIIDGICLNIETPEQSHETRYYIRRHGYKPNSGSDPIATDVQNFDTDGEQAVKIIKDGHVLIIRSGHVYTTFGQKLR